MSAEISRDELHGLSVSGGDSSSGGGTSPLTARSIRLERFAQALANSQEELRRYVEFLCWQFVFALIFQKISSLDEDEKLSMPYSFYFSFFSNNNGND